MAEPDVGGSRSGWAGVGVVLVGVSAGRGSAGLAGSGSGTAQGPMGEVPCDPGGGQCLLTNVSKL